MSDNKYYVKVMPMRAARLFDRFQSRVDKHFARGYYVRFVSWGFCCHHPSVCPGRITNDLETNLGPIQTPGRTSGGEEAQNEK